MLRKWDDKGITDEINDAKVADIRTGKKVSGEGFGCERTKRKDTGNSEKSLRKYRRQKVSKGCRSIRESRYEFQPGTVIQIGNKRRIVSGCHNKDALIQIQTKGFEPKDAPLKKCKILIKLLKKDSSLLKLNNQVILQKSLKS